MASVTSQYNAFDADMKKLKQNLRELGYMERPIGWVTFSWVYNLTISLVPAVLFFYTDNWLIRAILAFISGIGAVGIATCSHNASHGNIYKSAFVNRFLDIFGFSFIVGISSRFWDNLHNKLHHPNTGVVSVDPDTIFLPWLALHEKQLEEAGPLARVYYTKVQWLAFPILIGLYVHYLQVLGWKFIIKRIKTFKELDEKTRKLHYYEIFALVLHYVFWIGLFALYFPLLDVLILYFARNFIAGMFCFFALAPTHYSREALYFDKDILKMNYFARQMFSTINYRVGFFGSLLANGVEYHLDHHLFPQVSPALLKKLGGDIEKISRKHGMPYRSKKWLEIIFDAYRVILKAKVVDNSLVRKFVVKPN